MPSFTTQLPNLQAMGPIAEARVAVSASLENDFRKRGVQMPNPIAVHAMVDTGASVTVVRDDLPDQLGLQPVGVTSINTPSSTNVACYEYAVRLVLNNNVVIEATVIAAPLQGQNIQCLIGRDILAHGILVYIGYANTFSLSF